ncbi:metallophosphoesterase [Rubritalea spongiae]|uniref:Metallophosphoesterase n=1 Tax=Rubritalea spongiae TaxID=430797 RepID=A0ABW5E194_9BACT
MFSRRKSLKLLLAATPVAACAHAFLFEPKLLSITRREIIIPSLPPEFDGFTIAQLSDFHFKPGTDNHLMEEVVSSVNQKKVDLIALTGDYVTDDSEVIFPLLEYINRLQAKHGIYATLGNHDGWSNQRTFYKRLFEKSNIPFLINQNTELSINGESIFIAGTDYVWDGQPDAKQTLKGIHKDATVLALVHEPDYFDTMRSLRKIDIQLSGHTHGGQCRVPFIGYAPVKVRYGENYVYDHFERDGSQLFVSRGVGTSGLRVRFACPPELAILTLRSAES